MIRFFIAAMLLVSFTASSQGGWNIGYIEVDSITSKDITKQVKIDFKAKYRVGIDPKYRTARYFVSSNDTGQIIIDGKNIQLIERRKIYPDAGYYEEQYLESTGYESNRLLRLYDSEILEVKNDSILFRLHLEIYNKRKEKVTGEPRRDTALCWIEKSKLDGVMIKE